MKEESVFLPWFFVQLFTSALRFIIAISEAYEQTKLLSLHLYYCSSSLVSPSACLPQNWKKHLFKRSLTVSLLGSKCFITLCSSHLEWRPSITLSFYLFICLSHRAKALEEQESFPIFLHYKLSELTSVYGIL